MVMKVKEKWFWFLADESRAWKRKLEQVELYIASLFIAVSIIVIFIYGDGTSLQYVYIAFSIGTLFLSLSLIPLMKRQHGMNRIQRLLIIFSNLCLSGLVALSGLIILTAQSSNT